MRHTMNKESYNWWSGNWSFWNIPRSAEILRQWIFSMTCIKSSNGWKPTFASLKNIFRFSAESSKENLFEWDSFSAMKHKYRRGYQTQHIH